MKFASGIRKRREFRLAVCQCEVAGERVSDGAPHSQISGSSVRTYPRAENTDVIGYFCSESREASYSDV